METTVFILFVALFIAGVILIRRTRKGSGSSINGGGGGTQPTPDKNEQQTT